MDEYSRILIEKYCREHLRTKKARILSQLIEMSYDFACEPSDSDAIELEKIIEDERDPELRESLEDWMGSCLGDRQRRKTRVKYVK